MPCAGAERRFVVQGRKERPAAPSVFWSPAMAEQFEQVLTGAAADVAQFEEEAPSPLKRVQHFLHANPTAIPLIILVIGTPGVLAPRRTEVFPSLQSLADRLAGDADRHPRGGPDADRAHRRNRPLGRYHHDPGVGGHGQARSHRRRAGAAGAADRHLRRSALRRRQRRPGESTGGCRRSSSRSAPGASFSRSTTGIRASPASGRRTSTPSRRCSSS